MEHEGGFRFEASTRVMYDQIDLIVPAQRERLLADLRQRTGLPVKRVEIGRLDLLRDSAEIKIYYDAPKGAITAAHADSLSTATADDDE